MSTSQAVVSVRPPYASPEAMAPELSQALSEERHAADAVARTPFVSPEVPWMSRRGGGQSTATPPEVVATRVASIAPPRPEPDAAGDDPVGYSVETLPSIEQFLVQSETPAAGSPFLLGTRRLTSAETEAETEAETAAETLAEAELEAELEAESATLTEAEAFVEVESEASDDDWAMVDAVDEIAELVSDIGHDDHEATPTTGRRAHESDRSTAADEPWSDDDAWMDIMPALPNTGAGDDAARSDWARAFGEPLAPLTPAPMVPPPLPSGDAAAAAMALENVARRLRAGDLDVPGFHAASGDAAALASALASLLGAHR